MRGTALRLCAVVWVFGYILVELGAQVQGRTPYGVMFLAYLPLLALGIVQSVGLGLLLDHLESRPGWQRWGLMAIAGLVAGAVQTLADAAWLRMLARMLLPSLQAWALDFQPQRLLLVLILYTWTMFLSVALLWASRSADSARMNAARASAFEAAASRAEAAALRLQLNPHFLFNTLNGIASLVVRGRHDQAEEMIGRLADFLRSSLSSNPSALVPLDQELATIRAYLTIEEARFGERLQVDYAIDPELRRLEVPNFILQPLVENAIKHGAAQVRGAVTISIAARRGEGGALLSVVNRSGHRGGAPLSSEQPVEAEVRRGIGLTNTRLRLAGEYGQRAWLECRPLADGYRAEIGLPLNGMADAA
ncbi:sensor histidine kinase [Sphingomonas soli]|uniref:sensor histidine kinase n=1 Tax=Sphingomonas soli TaxID=266127 RepID=UPI000830758A|nr:histidine kinase [Sphingomonas soli]